MRVASHVRPSSRYYRAERDAGVVVALPEPRPPRPAQQFRARTVLREILPIMQGRQLGRFLGSIDRTPAGPHGCHLWVGSRNKAGYGLFQGGVSGEKFCFLAHRVAWALDHELEPENWVIRHSCDNPVCCRPPHLLSGTHMDNFHDMVERGRARLGLGRRPVDEAGRSEAIRLRFVEGWPMADICAVVGRHRATVSRWLGAYVREVETAAQRGVND